MIQGMLGEIAAMGSGIRTMDNGSAMRPRIALIHATPVSMEPIHAAFAASWPDARTVNILDDSLSEDRAESAELTDRMFERFAVLSRYAYDAGADAILF